MYMCMYVYVYICICVYVYVYVYVLCICICICIWIYTYIHMHLCVYMYIATGHIWFRPWNDGCYWVIWCTSWFHFLLKKRRLGRMSRSSNSWPKSVRWGGPGLELRSGPGSDSQGVGRVWKMSRMLHLWFDSSNSWNIWREFKLSDVDRLFNYVQFQKLSGIFQKRRSIWKPLVESSPNQNI